ncbi:PTS glucose transporter subunit IICBA [Pradoshia sp. D12]|uniref:glucose-specific PTS transporter subunit IIBC n=1 Tax=Bacillaceae TaxID=186817 RepID=UPI00080AE5F5|nr:MULTISPECIES: glucose-specific PTS transporter subunit IIBC [Bacillaceae]OCA80706.1 PTS glucose transporter subunit IICBA [Bacillus sp. FJAT-27986]QFK70084.1 PTS glucose transporter subunit IICBA [Pradoshia sp. D12]TPF70644.1 PTS glucose transporter subunit IICBA [Bacillus sp. D12]
MFKKVFGVLQKIGKALMLPVAILPAAGILLALGNAIHNPNLLDLMPFLDAGWIQKVATVMEDSGQIVFSNLSLLFAVGVAVGLAGGEGVAGLAAIIGYLIMNVTMGVVLNVTADMAANDPSYANVLGINTLQTGVFGGIIVGLLAAYMYNRFFRIELPSYLGFFAGKRFVPIITAASALILGLLMTLIWPPIQHGLNTLSQNMIDTNLTLAAFIFGVIERSLIPFGLHHIFYSPFWYEFGQYTNKAGEIVRGDQAIFFAQIKDGVKLTAGTFMTGKYPFMMFGLPAAALAIYHEAKPEKKTLVAGIMGSAALTSFLTGITEPMEFSFLFVAPVLFGIHAIFAGLSFMTMQLLNVKIGMTFSGGVIDFILFGIVPNRTAWWLVIPVGLVIAVIYYFGFRFAIRTWNLRTPGREDEDDESAQGKGGSVDELPYDILEAMGKKENIAHLDACITRLRVEVNDIAKVDKDKLKALGAAGVLEVGNNIQAIFGPRSETIKSQMKDIMAGNKPRPTKAASDNVEAEIQQQIEEVNPDALKTDFSKGEFAAPLEGQLIPISEVPDQVFAEKMMGDGFAMIPSEGIVASPVDGEIISIFPTKHALAIKSDSGHELLIHVGIDTVKLNGKGFETKVKDGDKITQGQILMEFDLNFIKSNATSIITPIVFTNLLAGEGIKLVKQGKVKLGEVHIVDIM